jgi:hypothetical protein
MEIRLRIENMAEVQASVGAAGNAQARFATAVALTRTAVKARDVVRKELLELFTIRRVSWAQKGVRAVPATRQNLQAVVEDINAYMVLQQTGGTKIPYGKFIAVPLEGARPTPTALIKPEDMPKAVMAAGGFIRGNVMYRAKQVYKKQRRRKGLVGPVNASRQRNQIVPMYALVSRAHLVPRYGMDTLVAKTVSEVFGAEFARAFAQATTPRAPHL